MYGKGIFKELILSSLARYTYICRSERIITLCSGLMLCVASCVAIPSSDTLRVLDSVRVTAAVVSQDLTSSIPRYSVSQDQMRKWNIMEASDAFTRIPGVALRDYGGAGGMKTVSVRGLGAGHTAVAIDGITQTDAQSGQVDFSRFNMLAAEDVSLIMGDGGNLFQTARSISASTLVEINTTGKLHRLIEEGNAGRGLLKMEQGSFERWGMEAACTWNSGKDFALAAYGKYLFAGNNYPYILENGRTHTHERRTNSRMNAFQGDLASAWKIRNGGFLDVKTGWYDNNHHLPGQTVYYNPHNGEVLHEREAWVQASWQREWQEKWGVSVKGKWDWNESRYKNKNDIYPDGCLRQNYRQKEIYANTVIKYDSHQWWAASYAIDFFQNRLKSNQTSYGNVWRNSLLQAFTMKSYGKRFSMTASALFALYENHAESGDNARDINRWGFTCSAICRLLPEENLYLRGFYKEVNRPPSFTESYYYHLGSTNLKAEHASQWGAGLTFHRKITRWWYLENLSLDGYINRVDDKIVSVPVNMYLWRTINVGIVDIKGADAMMQNLFALSAKHRISVDASGSVQYVRDKSAKGSITYGKQLAYTPRLTGHISIAYENPWVNGSVTLTGCSSRWGTHEHAHSTRLAGYGEWDFSCWRTLPWRKNTIVLKMAVQNAGNKQYALMNGYPMPGRSYRIDIMFNFNNRKK